MHTDINIKRSDILFKITLRLKVCSIKKQFDCRNPKFAFHFIFFHVYWHFRVHIKTLLQLNSRPLNWKYFHRVLMTIYMFFFQFLKRNWFYIIFGICTDLCFIQQHIIITVNLISQKPLICQCKHSSSSQDSYWAALWWNSHFLFSIFTSIG